MDYESSYTFLNFPVKVTFHYETGMTVLEYVGVFFLEKSCQTSYMFNSEISFAWEDVKDNRTLSTASGKQMAANFSL